MNQIIGLLDAYAYPSLVWDVFVERCERSPSNEERIAAALPRARLVLGTLSRLKREGPWMLGNQLTLADLHAGPMLEYFKRAPEGAALLQEVPLLEKWWARLKHRESFRSLTS
ncbi:MAG TPA: glutathione S-transferase domain-containing protein [Tianweitania sediminis]|nr:glutathione S-transferase domain-containing protein [Tianweitania sediminis]